MSSTVPTTAPDTTDLTVVPELTVAPEAPADSDTPAVSDIPVAAADAADATSDPVVADVTEPAEPTADTPAAAEPPAAAPAVPEPAMVPPVPRSTTRDGEEGMCAFIACIVAQAKRGADARGNY